MDEAGALGLLGAFAPVWPELPQNPVDREQGCERQDLLLRDSRVPRELPELSSLVLPDVETIYVDQVCEKREGDLALALLRERDPYPSGHATRVGLVRVAHGDLRVLCRFLKRRACPVWLGSPLSFCLTGNIV